VVALPNWINIYILIYVSLPKVCQIFNISTILNKRRRLNKNVDNITAGFKSDCPQNQCLQPIIQLSA